MKVLHDWDNPYISGKYAIKRGIKLILYGIFKKIGIKYPREIYDELENNLYTIIRLDRISDITSVIGVHDSVNKEFPNIMNKLKSIRNIDVREHYHFKCVEGEKTFPVWNPPLYQSERTYWYDIDYSNGKKIMIGENELPCFHLDYPYLLSDYIDFLYNVLILGEKIYE